MFTGARPWHVRNTVGKVKTHWELSSQHPRGSEWKGKGMRGLWGQMNIGYNPSSARYWLGDPEPGFYLGLGFLIYRDHRGTPPVQMKREHIWDSSSLLPWGRRLGAAQCYAVAVVMVGTERGKSGRNCGRICQGCWWIPGHQDPKMRSCPVQ